MTASGSSLLRSPDLAERADRLPLATFREVPNQPFIPAATTNTDWLCENILLPGRQIRKDRSRFEVDGQAENRPRRDDLNRTREATETEQRTKGRSEERRVGKECRSRWSAYH